MAKPKVFISSTCYDLGSVRAELRPFIESIGYEPIMSEFSDILFDPRRHTHDSCVREIVSADILVLIVGSRLGGEALPSATDLVNFDQLSDDWNSSKSSEFKDKLSITQLEVLKAIENGIPVYTFVETGVNRDHLFYEKNKKKKSIIAEAEFPSIAKSETAIYIFEFINFLRKRSRNNSVFEFSNIEDIRKSLRSQWAHLFQRLLDESRSDEKTSREFNAFSNQIEDLKAVVLASIGSDQLKQTASGVLRYRMLFDFLTGLLLEDRRDIVLGDLVWDDILERAGIAEIMYQIYRRPSPRPDQMFVKNDRTFYLFRGSEKLYSKIQNDWADFRALNAPAREAVYDALIDTKDGRPNMLLRYHAENVAEFFERMNRDDSDDD